MAPLTDDIRKLLEKEIGNARETAEAAAKVSLATLAVERQEPFATMGADQRCLRNALRAKARQLGGGDWHEGIALLIEEIAYQQWHRMLFARFLAENRLLFHPSGMAVTLGDCAELAPDEGESDAWMLAARYASAMLPGIFRADDPAAQVRFAPEGRAKLEALLHRLPPGVFKADDALGWVYQFWQARRKKEINESGRKIGARELPAVTQLFTEHYMVQFLLENSLGAWWAARHPGSPLTKEWSYQRFRDDGTPAAGTFPGWPERAAQVTVMDPCCGSGHFLVAAFEMLRRMRMEEERLDEAQAGDAVLHDNLFGLEIDPRCTQIAAFALAFAAWKSGGYRLLPLPNIACSGIAVHGQREAWTRLAGDDRSLQIALERIYDLFKDAPVLGSLINPAHVPVRDRMFTPDYARIEPLLEKALRKERDADDPTAEVFGAAAEGVLRAAKLLAGKYTFVATNVPFLNRVKQDEVLMQFCESHHPLAKSELATVFVERCQSFTAAEATYAVITPQNWLFLGRYAELRRQVLITQTWGHVTYLGSKAFQTITGEVVKPVCLVIHNASPKENNHISGLDVSDKKTILEKKASLIHDNLTIITQGDQINNPKALISFRINSDQELLDKYSISAHGVGTFDSERFFFFYWEIVEHNSTWLFSQSTVKKTVSYGGRETILRWEEERGALFNLISEMRSKGYTSGKWKAGRQVWGMKGVVVSLIGDLPACLYTGQPFDDNTGVIIPKNPSHLPAIWAFCSSFEFNKAVRQINRKLNVPITALVKVPFDLEQWQRVADEAGPLPELYSNDPTQWLFKGLPTGSTAPLQVAVAKLLGYHWPAEDQAQAGQMGVTVTPEEQRLLRALGEHSDSDGIVCIPAVAGERPAAERLRAFLAVAYGDEWSPALQERLLQEVGFGGKGLDSWLRDGFFAQHCRLFHNRPFIWHIWDGRKDGFAVLVNYHKLDTRRLEKLIYTYLGNWIDRQRAARDSGDITAEGRLIAALELKKKLEAIREGEPPYDIYVRWKPLHEQPMGWEPDLNDGVRLNIRPFVKAEVLRAKFTINWNNDRGKNPDGSERRNDLHYTLAEKRAAREEVDV